MDTKGFCFFNFSHKKVKDKISDCENEYRETAIKLNDIAIQKKIRYFDVNKNKKRQELEATNDPEALIQLKRFNQLKDSIKRLTKLLDNISERQLNYIDRKQYRSQKYEYQLFENGKAHLNGIQFPSSTPDYIFSLTDYYKPVFSKAYEIKATIHESFIVNTEEDRDNILLDKDVEEVLFLADKAFIKRTDNIYLVRNEMTGILEWSDNAYSTIFSNSQYSLEKDYYQNLECIYRVVPFIKSDWLGKEIRDVEDINDRTPWEDFYKTVDTTGYIRLI